MTAEKLLASLKRHNPARVVAYAGDDDARAIAVPTRRKRWAQVIEAIQALAWTRVEMQDKAGAVLGYVENTEPASGLADLGTDKSAGELRLAERIVTLVLKGQRDAMTFRDAEVTALLKAQGDVVREMTAGMRALTSMYQEQVVAAEQLAETRAMALATPEKGDLAQLLDAAPQIVQALPLIRALLGGENAAQSAPHVNGTRPKG